MAEFVADSAGARLRQAREAAGIDRAALAARTRIAERHLAAIEEGRYAALPGRTYAFGFARSYARAVGLEEGPVLAQIRRELGTAEAPPAATGPVFVPGDPARVPSARFAWVAGLLAVILALAGGVWWRMVYEPAPSLPSLLPDQGPTNAAPSASAARPAPPPAVAPPVATAPPASGPVVFTALTDRLWVKFYDASGKQLMQKQMAKGETYTVPADAVGPRLWTGQPDALAITIGGRPVPPLATKHRIMKDVPVTAAALATRPATPAATTPAATPATVAPPHGRHRRADSRMAPDALPAADAAPPPAAAATD